MNELLTVILQILLVKWKHYEMNSYTKENITKIIKDRYMSLFPLKKCFIKLLLIFVPK